MTQPFPEEARLTKVAEIIAEELATFTCEPSHLHKWPLANEDRFCGKCWSEAEDVARFVEQRLEVKALVDQAFRDPQTGALHHPDYIAAKRRSNANSRASGSKPVYSDERLDALVFVERDVETVVLASEWRESHRDTWDAVGGDS